ARTQHSHRGRNLSLRNGRRERHQRLLPVHQQVQPVKDPHPRNHDRLKPAVPCLRSAFHSVHPGNRRLPQHCPGFQGRHALVLQLLL
ncbi:hypothetical protein HDU77_001744, partial [Chytriomyces hyalinus]